MTLKKQFTQSTDQFSSADPTPGQQRAAFSQQSCMRKESQDNCGEEKKPLHTFWSFRSYCTAHPCQLTPTSVSPHCVSFPLVYKTRGFLTQKHMLLAACHFLRWLESFIPGVVQQADLLICGTDPPGTKGSLKVPQAASAQIQSQQQHQQNK